MHRQKPVAERPRSDKRRSKRWGVILAGGDGTRLLSLTRAISGDDRPKQFCSLTGGETLLDQTRRRVSGIIADRRTLFLLTQTHERFYANQLAGVAGERLLTQPYNHGTAPAIAYSLTYIDRLDPDAVVAFFPSDHHFANDNSFAAHIDLAFAQAEMDPERVILLGILPDVPEESYGWIEPGESVAGGAVSEVRRFWEKPSRRVATQLMRGGCLWNSFVMVGRVSAFLAMIRRTLPELLTSFTGMQSSSLREIYAKIPAANFSNDVLSARPSDLTVLPARGLGWSDLGEPQRVLSAIPKLNWNLHSESILPGLEVPA
jgi:mannose-1-phosphate guanylyltransferase